MESHNSIDFSIKYICTDYIQANLLSFPHLTMSVKKGLIITIKWALISIIASSGVLLHLGGVWAVLLVVVNM